MSEVAFGQNEVMYKNEKKDEKAYLKKYRSGNRNVSLDVAKGVGIILVVICHLKLSFMTTYIYWFHMPLFFIISGYLFKKPDKKDDLLLVLFSKTCRYLIPYFSFYFLILIVLRLDTHLRPLITSEDVKLLLRGGVNLVGAFGPFWFITVLYFTQIIFLLITRCLNTKVVTVLLILCYILSHLPVFKVAVIWDANVTLYSLTFFGFGYMLHMQPLEKEIKKIAMVISVITVIISVGLQALGVIHYSLDMKSATYNNVVLDVVIPIAFSLVILGVSKLISESLIGKCLAEIGKYTLPIMYLHIPISYLMLNHFDLQNTVVIRVLAGIIIPILLSKFIFEKFNITRMICLGYFKPEKKFFGLKIDK